MAEVSEIADGTYDFVKTKGDGTVLFRNVPTADGIKDIVSITDHKLSIKFGNEPSRSGKFYLCLKNDYPLHALEIGGAPLDVGTQFEASSLPVMAGATFTYRIDWEGLRAGEKGVTIEVDEKSDGNIDFTGSVGATLDDSIAPTTTADLSGTQLPTGRYLPAQPLPALPPTMRAASAWMRRNILSTAAPIGPVTRHLSPSMKEGK